MIEFKFIRWKNFLSTGNNFIEIQLDRNPTTLIIGENGAGKSTVLDALCFGLFGKPFRNINKPQLLNSVNNSSAVVEVEFKIGSKNIKVVRGIKPNIFEIYINGKMYNQDANVRDYQNYLEQQILKLNYRSFTQVVILGSSTFVPFMQLRARHRREVVEEILDIQIFSLMNMLLKQRLKSIADDIRDIDYQLELTTEKIQLQNQYIDDIKKNKNKIIAEKNMIHSGNEEEIYKRSGEIDSLKKENDDLVSSISDKVNLDNKLTKLKDIKSTLTEKHKTHFNMVDFFENNTDCPTCEQHIDEIFKKDMIVKKQDEADKLESGLSELETELIKTKNRIKDITDIAIKIRENEVQIAKDKSGVDQLEKFNIGLSEDIVKLTEDEGVNQKDYVRLKRLKENLSDVTNQKSKLREDMTYSEAARSMLQDTGIKTKIIKQYLPIMNKLINTYLIAMEFYVNFTLNESFEETIKSRYRDEFTYDSFSEGE